MESTINEALDKALSKVVLAKADEGGIALDGRVYRLSEEPSEEDFLAVIEKIKEFPLLTNRESRKVSMVEVSLILDNSKEKAYKFMTLMALMTNKFKTPIYKVSVFAGNSIIHYQGDIANFTYISEKPAKTEKVEKVAKEEKKETKAKDEKPKETKKEEKKEEVKSTVVDAPTGQSLSEIPATDVPTAESGPVVTDTQTSEAPVSETTEVKKVDESKSAEEKPKETKEAEEKGKDEKKPETGKPSGRNSRKNS